MVPFLTTCMKDDWDLIRFLFTECIFTAHVTHVTL